MVQTLNGRHIPDVSFTVFEFNCVIMEVGLAGTAGKNT